MRLADACRSHANPQVRPVRWADNLFGTAGGLFISVRETTAAGRQAEHDLPGFVSVHVQLSLIMRPLVFITLCQSLIQLASAEPIQFQSGAIQTPLLELYTSEGCSSCPPAEAWLSRLKESPNLWKDFVPVAFHVDYWDHLGWKDPFATAAFSERQRDYADHWRSHSVYTPGFVLDGQEWRGWFNRDELPRASSKLVGVLSARSEGGKQWTLRFRPATTGASASYEFHAALLGFDLASGVKAGENRGRVLEHDFVVLALTGAASSKDGEVVQAALSLRSKFAVSPKRLAFAAWVTSAKSLQPVQTLGGWLALASH